MKKFIIFLYCIFLLLFSIFSYTFVDPNLFYLKAVYSDFAFSNKALSTIFYIFFVFLFFIFYGIFLWLGIKKRLSMREFFLLVFITSGILFFSYPAMLSYDIFNYVATSKVLFFYHENPYVVMPIELSGEPLLSFMHGANKIALYGPFWIVLAGIPYFLGFGNFIVTLFSFKFFIILSYLGTVFLVWKISKNVISLILFALNPLIIIETLVSGHNDITMIFLIISSYFLLMNKKTFLGILLFILSILVKYTTILLVPILFYIFWQTIKKREINWKNVFYFSSLLMYIGFLLSPIREEIYPWYAIWFLSFAFLVLDKKLLLYISIAFSFSLLFRYTPYMLTGTYAGKTPFIKEMLSFAFPVLFCIYYGFKKKI